MHKHFYGVASMPKSQRGEFAKIDESPGPGAYEVAQDRNHNDLPKWSLKKKLRHGSCFQDLSNTPAPGSYELANGQVPPLQFKKKASSKRNGFKVEKYRTYAQKKMYPSSPLNIPSSINLKCGHSFGYRDPERVIQTSPGPIYNIENQQIKKRLDKTANSCKGFGSGSKNEIYKHIDNDRPGPGSYSIENFASRSMYAWTIGKSEKKDQIIKNPLGPGEYDPQTSSVQRVFKIKGKFQQPRKDIFKTGPGSYDLPDTKSKIGTRFNENKNSEYLLNKHQKQNSLLSPFTYNPGRYLDNPKKNVGFTLGQKIEKNQVENNDKPGPGAYELSKDQKKGGGYMGRKIEVKKKDVASDNFYKYDPKIGSVSRQYPKFSFPQGKRSMDQENHSFSPVSTTFYDVSPKKTEGYTIGNSKRFEELKKEGIPYKDSQKNFGTIGYLPTYLKPKDNNSKNGSN